MKQNIMKKWVKALRSGKYKQGQSYLKQESLSNHNIKHCCLGVLCELYNDTMKKNKKKSLTEKKQGWLYKFGKSDSLLPSVVKKWAGMKSNEGSFKDKDGFLTSLTDMNDFGDSFKKIATIIEKKHEDL